MRISALLAAVFVAGLVASFALASPTKHSKGDTSAQTTTTTEPKKPKKPKCEQAELKGTATGASFSLAVTKANKRGKSLVGTTVHLVIPSGAEVKAKVCTIAGGGLTLRDLHVKVKPPKP